MLQVREAEEADGPELGRILAESFQPYLPPLESQDDIRSFIGLGDCYVALSDHQLVGLIIYKTKPLTVHIKAIAVKPSHRRKGIAHQLLKTVVSSSGTRLIVLRTSKMMKPAIQTYSSFGFVREPELDPVGSNMITFLYRRAAL